MSGHRIAAIIAFALCTSGAFATNESAANGPAANEPFDCEENWPCNYFTKREATFYPHKIEDYNSPIDGMNPDNERTSYGRTVLHFASNSLDGPAGGYQIQCSNGKLWNEHTVTSGTMVYVTGESQSFTMPDGWHWVYRVDGDNRGWEGDGLHDWVVKGTDEHSENKSAYWENANKETEKYLEHVFPYWEDNDIKREAIWRCQDEKWWHDENNSKDDVDSLHPCSDGAADLGVRNNRTYVRAAVKTLVPDDAEGFDVAYRTVIAPPHVNQPCLTYRCKSGYKATCNFYGKDGQCNGEPMSCVPVHTACSMPDGQYMVKDQADVADCNEKYSNSAGSRYINWLKDQMGKSLTKYNTYAEELYKIAGGIQATDEMPFICDNNGCTLREDEFNGLLCEFRCFDDGIRVRLAPEQDGERYTIKCPNYFKPVFNDNAYTYKYTCVFDTAKAQRVITRINRKKQAAAAQDAEEDKNACATAICGASGGVYDSATQRCKCGNDVCTTKFGDTSYKYCGGEQRGPFIHFCGDTGLASGVPERHPCYKNNNATECYKELVQAAYNATPACATAASLAAAGDDSAADDATDDNISDLAKTLDAIENAYGLSKWRTVDGKFNYARLASDATAAVVLGTTGALVTSSVVKKKQVEAGFESLECTVGGQHVGDWGDVFRIDGK